MGMMNRLAPLRVVIADDDPDDRKMIADAFESVKLPFDLHTVEDGEALMDYLKRRGAYGDMDRPDLLLVDLNMPRKDGREALREIKADPHLRAIPTIVLTVSADEEDVRFAYEVGASTFIRKPMRFSELIETIHSVASYWARIAEFPEE